MNMPLSQGPSENHELRPTDVYTPKMIGVEAQQLATFLTAQKDLNYDGAARFASVPAQLLNTGLLTENAYQSLPIWSREALTRMASGAADYLRSVGQQPQLAADMERLMPDGSETTSTLQIDRYFFDKMETHVRAVGPREAERRDRERQAKKGRLVFAGGNPFDMTVEFVRLSGDIPYDESGIRAVVQIYGNNFGLFLEGLEMVVPYHADHKRIYRTAIESIHAARPADYSQA